MSSNGFKGHENGDQNGSDDQNHRRPEYHEEERVSVVRNLFPETEEEADARARAVVRGTMAEFLRHYRREAKKEAKKKQKTENLDAAKNAPSSVKHESRGVMQIEDGGTSTNQPKTGGKQKIEICAVHQKRRKETQAKGNELQNKRLESRKAAGKAIIDTYPRAPTEGLPGFSESAIMQDINLCEKCDCTEEEQPCMKCRGYNWHCQGTCECCEVQRNIEEAMKDVTDYPTVSTKVLPGFSKSSVVKDIKLCEKCDCTKEEQPCMKCSSYIGHCQGTCTCCEAQRNMEEAMKDVTDYPSLPVLSESSIVKDIKLCEKCDCTKEEQPCMKCRGYFGHCQGTCLCCEVQRNMEEAMKDVTDYPGLPVFSESSIVKDIKLCEKCDCTKEEQPCMKCRGYFGHCEGTCTCCEVQRSMDEAMKDIK